MLEPHTGGLQVTRAGFYNGTMGCRSCYFWGTRCPQKCIIPTAFFSTLFLLNTCRILIMLTLPRPGSLLFSPHSQVFCFLTCTICPIFFDALPDVDYVRERAPLFFRNTPVLAPGTTPKGLLWLPYMVHCRIPTMVPGTYSSSYPLLSPSPCLGSVLLSSPPIHRF